MKRDMDLVRQLLANIEAAESSVSVESLAVAVGRPKAEASYHLRLLQAHGLIDATLKQDITGDWFGQVLGLTWDGCDYLDAIRDERVWERTKKVVSETVGSTTMAVVKSAAVAVAEALIKSAIL